MSKMTIKKAVRQITETLRSCSREQIEDLAIILNIGAGNITLDHGHRGYEETLDAFVTRARRELSWDLIDSINDQEYVPVYAGPWEEVVTALVLDKNWPKLAETAEDLITKEHLDDLRSFCPGSGFWKIERLNKAK
jgi:hypothetical protein